MKKLFNTYDSFVMNFKSQQDLEKALNILQLARHDILDIQSPHYIALNNLPKKVKQTPYGIIAGMSGAVGFILISMLIFYVMSKPQLMFGNKGSLPIMAYIPVLFTVSILFSGIGLLLAFSYKNHLLPGQQNQLIYPLDTSENYILIIGKKMNLGELQKLISDIDTVAIFEYKFMEQNIHLALPLKVK